LAAFGSGLALDRGRTQQEGRRVGAETDRTTAFLIVAALGFAVGTTLRTAFRATLGAVATATAAIASPVLATLGVAFRSPFRALGPLFLARLAADRLLSSRLGAHGFGADFSLLTGGGLARLAA
jgi:hypothetical protein